MQPHVRWCRETVLAPLSASPSEARAFVGRHLLDHQLSHLVEDVRLVASELVTNAVMHARTPIALALEELPFCVMLSVHDDSPLQPVTTVAHADAIGGRGMNLVEQFSNGWGVTPGLRDDKTVWASFALRPVLMTAESAGAQVGRLPTSPLRAVAGVDRLE
jgi:hypothetical protein